MAKQKRKQPGVWPRGKTGWWYSTINGKQKRLARTKVAAQEELNRLLSVPPLRPSDEDSMADLLLAYLNHVRPAEHGKPPNSNAVKPDRFRDLKIVFTDFAQHFGDVLVKDLRPADMDAWHQLHKVPTPEHPRPWSSSTFTFKVSCIRRAINWAVDRNDVTANPLKAFVGPGYERRDHLITDAEFKILLRYAMPWLADLIYAMRQTGCRPSEACRVTAADYDPKRRCWQLREHKRRKKKPAPRVIWLTDGLVKLTEKLVAKHPEGPIFRDGKGNAIYKQQVVRAFRLAKETAAKRGNPLPVEVVAYGCRHRWITDALVSGIDALTVATLAGTSLQMIERNYSHLLQRADAMQAAAEKAVSKQKGARKKTS